MLNKNILLKSISYRILAMITTFSIVYAMTGELAIATGVGLFDTIFKLIIFYFHECFWIKKEKKDKEREGK